jgi:hypothetical protein
MTWARLDFVRRSATSLPLSMQYVSLLPSVLSPTRRMRETGLASANAIPGDKSLSHQPGEGGLSCADPKRRFKGYLAASAASIAAKVPGLTFPSVSSWCDAWNSFTAAAVSGP